MYRLSVISDGVSNDFAQAARIIREAGFQWVELQTVDRIPIGDQTGDQLKTISATLHAEQLNVACLSRNLFGGLDVRSTVPSDRAYLDQMDALRSTMDAAHALSTPLVRIMSFAKLAPLFGDGGAETTIVLQDAWTRMLRLFEAPIRVAEAAGIQLVVETSAKGMICSAFLARKLVDELASPTIQVLWDPGNALLAGECPIPDGYDQLRGGVLGHVHLKDMVANTARSFVASTRFGDGDMAPFFAQIRSRLDEDRYTGCISLENIYRPANGSFTDGFAASAPRFLRAFAATELSVSR